MLKTGRSSGNDGRPVFHFMGRNKMENEQLKGSRFYAWTTRDEIEFIKCLGQHAISRTPSRQELLRRYIRSSELRAEWGEVSKRVVLLAANAALAEASQRSEARC
jgi:hypothetical protein